jgi:SP family facilitated glucose transporter-like MFS transporter 8
MMLSVTPLPCISFLIVGVTFNTYAWMVGRFVMGFAGAVIGVAAPIFVAGIAQHDIRGTFELLLPSPSCTWHCSGVHPWSDRKLECCAFTAAFPFIFFVIFIFMPETPTFLLRKGKSEDGAKKL